LGRDTVDRFIASNQFYQQAEARARQLASAYPGSLAYAFYLTPECSAARAYLPDRAITAVACPAGREAEASLLAARTIPPIPPATGGGLVGRQQCIRADDALGGDGPGKPEDAHAGGSPASTGHAATPTGASAGSH
jgi:hypothetical protein